MGSANCKEYVTSKKDNSSPIETADNGTRGSYHSTSETNMTENTEMMALCHVTEIEDNEMKTFDIGEGIKVLLIKQNGVLNAIGNKCPHYGAPLNTGVLGLGRLRCPWHGACFNIETGDIEDFPGMDSLPCYKVTVASNGKVIIHLKPGDRENTRRRKNMILMSPTDKRTFVIVGGGPAGAVCAETLRQESFTGHIVMVCREKYLPYDRVKLSKAMNTDLESIIFRPEIFYNQHSIDTMLGVEATKVDAQNKVLHLSNKNAIQFDKMFIATGCQPLRPPIKGVELQNVFTLRDYTDASNIHHLLNIDRHVVCLGGSFISLEAAAYCTKRVKSITVVARSNVPFKESFGSEVGERILRLFEQNEVRMIMNSGIVEIIGNSENQVSEVELTDGSKIPCDILILGTGSRFYTEFLRDSGIKLNANGSVEADINLRTNFRDIFVGGDIAHAPVYCIGNEKANVQHYQLAQYHGRKAAINMCGSSKELRAVPFFFTMLYGKGLRYAGYGPFENVFIDGSLEELKFVAYYLDKENYVVGVLSCQRDPIVASFAELLSQGKRLNLSEIEGKEDTQAWIEKLRTTKCTC